MNIELKGAERQPTLIDKVLEIIYAENVWDRVILSSFQHSYYERFLELVEKSEGRYKLLPFSFLFAYVGSEPAYQRYTCVDFKRIKPYPFNGICFPAKEIDNEQFLKLIREARERNLFISCYFSLTDDETYEIYDKLVA